MTQILVVGPHPDDQELGMGGTIAKLVDQGHDVLLLDMTSGEPTPHGTPELRAKESDRLEAMSNSLNRLGVSFDECADGIDIQGLNQEYYSSNRNLPFKAAIINSFDDHRIAMASAIACTRAPNESKVEDVDNVITSFPNFLDTCRRIGMEIDNS